MIKRFIRAVLPEPIYRLRRHQVIRQKARELLPLRYPEVSFAELCRASRLNGKWVPFQVESEIVRLLEIVHERQCQTLLEIGTAAGGTLFLLTRAASRHAKLLTLDLRAHPVRWECLQRFALGQQRVICLQGNSNSQEGAAKVAAELAGRPLDFLLIDGDPSAYAVRRDFELYRPMVAPGGLVVFHDICRARGVKEFWNELRGTCRSEELIEDRNQQECGLGLLYV